MKPPLQGQHSATMWQQMSPHTVSRVGSHFGGGGGGFRPPGYFAGSPHSDPRQARTSRCHVTSPLLPQYRCPWIAFMSRLGKFATAKATHIPPWAFAKQSFFLLFHLAIAAFWHGIQQGSPGVAHARERRTFGSASANPAAAAAFSAVRREWGRDRRSNQCSPPDSTLTAPAPGRPLRLCRGCAPSRNAVPCSGGRR